MKFDCNDCNDYKSSRLNNFTSNTRKSIFMSRLF